MSTTKTAPASPRTDPSARAATHGRRALSHGGRRPRSGAQPMHEALAMGLGCVATGYRMTPSDEWR